MQTIIDPIIGPLTFQGVHGGAGWWKKLEPLALIGGPVLLEVHADLSGPTKEQRQVYLSLSRPGEGLRTELQKALYVFYKIQREAYADACADIEGYVEDFLPVLQSSAEVWGILSPLSWSIVGPETADDQAEEAGEKYDAKYDAMLSWYGCWDEEHEFSALFRGGRFLGIEALGSFYGPLDLKPEAG